MIHRRPVRSADCDAFYTPFYEACSTVNEKIAPDRVVFEFGQLAQLCAGAVCSSAAFATGVQSMKTICCSGGDCDPLPTTCSPECKSFYGKFYEACSTSEMAGSISQFTALADVCAASTVDGSG